MSSSQRNDRARERFMVPLAVCVRSIPPPTTSSRSQTSGSFPPFRSQLFSFLPAISLATFLFSSRHLALLRIDRPSRHKNPPHFCLIVSPATKIPPHFCLIISPATKIRLTSASSTLPPQKYRGFYASFIVQRIIIFSPMVFVLVI